jgi:hypothetical protein
MQLMLLEQQNKKRLMMARQEQDNMGGIPRGDGPSAGPNGPNGQMMPEASPHTRSGASPNPAEQMKRGTPQMSNNGMGSPLPDGAQSRGSPNPMNFMGNEMNPQLNPQFFKEMNNGNMAANGHINGMRPPSSHPGQQGQQQQFNGQVTPQMMAAAGNRPGAAGQANAAGQQVQWPQGGPNGNQMAQGPQGQGQVQGTPQQRNSMPPPSGPAAAASNANNRTTASPQQTPSSTPSQASKPAPKKKDTKAKSKVGYYLLAILVPMPQTNA